MKKYLIIVVIISTILSGCSTQGSDISISENQEIVSNIRSIYLSNAIGSLDNNIFNDITFKDIISTDIDQLILVQNEVPFLKNNLIQFNDDVHVAFRKATVTYQDILNKYSRDLEFPVTYPNERNYYAIEEAGIDVLLDNYGELVNQEISEAMDTLFELPIKEYSELAANYNIYCESLDALNRQSLSQINPDIEKKLKQLFLDRVYSSILNSEKNYLYERNSFEPHKITIEY
jgi:hypothetical protein